MRDEEGDIAFTGDIVSSVAYELGMPKEKIAHHLDFMTHWIKHLTKIPTVLRIYIPHVGSLFLNWSRVEKEYNHFNSLPKDQLSQPWVNRLRLNRERLDEFEKVFEGEEGYIRHKKRAKIFNPYFTKGKSLEELEKWQNK